DAIHRPDFATALRRAGLWRTVRQRTPDRIRVDLAGACDLRHGRLHAFATPTALIADRSLIDATLPRHIQQAVEACRVSHANSHAHPRTRRCVGTTPDQAARPNRPAPPRAHCASS